MILSPPRDLLGRFLRDLRISVTDRCNFRCTYCMPREVFGPDHPFLPRAEILSFEEIARVARIFAALGVQKFRLTGGEPLLRRDLPVLIRQIREAAPNAELTLTTNGSLLAKHAQALRDAGLHRVTVSLDALDDATFQRMSDARFTVADVLEGIEAARAAGFGPIKINAVLQKGVNDHVILPLVRQFGRTDTIRFIEYMDVGASNGWERGSVITAPEILAQIQQEIPLRKLPPQHASDTAVRYATPWGGEVGIIASVTQPFCGACTRARLTADGRIYTCLFGTDAADLRAVLRSGATDDALADFVSGLWSRRGDRYSELRAAGKAPAGRKAEMSELGG